MTFAHPWQQRIRHLSGRRFERIGWMILLTTSVVLSEFCANTAMAAFSLVIVAISYVLSQRSVAAFDFRHVSICTFWFLSYLAMIYFPAFFVYANQEGPYRGRYLFAVESVLVTVPLGWWFASSCFNFYKEDITRYFGQPIEFRISSDKLYRRVGLLLLLLGILTIFYLRDVGTIPLFYLLRNPGDFLRIPLLREDSFKLLDSPLKYVYALVRGVGFPTLIAVSFGAFLRTRKKKWALMFAACTALGIFFASLSLAKAPVAAIVLVLALFFYLYRGGVISRKVIASFLVLVLLFPVAVILLVSDEDTTLCVALGHTAWRLLYDPSEGIYYYFEVFPSHVPYLRGRSIGKLALLFGAPYFNTPNYVGLYQDPFSIESVNANAGFIGDLNADFGLWGVMLGGILAGFVMQSCQIYVIRRPKTVTNLALFAFLVLAFWYLHSTSLPVVLASNGVVLAIALIWLLERSRSVVAYTGQSDSRKIVQDQ